MKSHLYFRKVRKHCKYSVEKMSELLGISVSAYSFLEYGEPLWDTKKLIKKAKEIKNEYDKIHST